MKLTQKPNTESPQNFCPVTGLPILCRPEWTNVRCSSDFSESVSVLGDSILYVELSGNATLDAIKNGLLLTNSVIEEAIVDGQPYIQILDYSNLKSFSREARKHIIENKKGNERLTGIIICVTSPMTKLSIKLAQRFNIFNFKIEIVNDYAEAVTMALTMLSTSKPEAIAFPIEITPHPLTETRERDEVCPVTRLSVTTRPEWTDVDLGDECSVTFKFIGNTILLSIPHGKAIEHTMERYFQERSHVCNVMPGAGEPFVEITNYSELEGKIFTATNSRFKDMITDKDNCIGHIGYGLSLPIRLAINMGNRFHRSPIPFFTERNYETAVRKAVKIVTSHGYDVEHLPPITTTRPDWILKLDGYSTQYSIIDNHIIHGVTSGFLEERHVPHIFTMLDKLIGEIDPRKDSYYFIFDVTELKGSTKNARRLYLDSFKTWDESHPFNLVIFCGANRMISAAFNLARPFVHFKGRMVNNLHAALKVIAEEKSKSTNTRLIVGNSTAKANESGDTRQYVDGLLQYIGNIDWETDGLDDNIKVDFSHPFMPVYDALSLVKNDLNDLFQEHKKAVNSLKESEERYRTILESIEDGYYEVDLAGNFTFCNDSLCTTMGYSRNELIGTNGQEYMDKETAQDVYKTFNGIYATGKPERGFEWEFIRKDNSKGYIELSISPIKDAHDKVTGFRGIARDISDRKRAEKLQKAKTEAEAASRAKSEFLAKMSHEIRTPLNGIIGMAELAMETNLDENQQEIIRAISLDSNSLLDIVNDILDFSKIEAGKLEFEEIPFDPRYLIDVLCAGLAREAECKDLEIISFLSPHVPSLLIGDPGRLRQILLNLLSNALKFTHKGEIYIKGEVAEDQGHQVKLRFSIRDTGIGIPSEKQATIFESFTQVDNSTTRTYGGTGLGTSISKQLAELMGGEIGVTSEEGKGSTFVFTSLFTKQKEKQAFPVRDKVNLKGTKILVVDDNETSLHTLAEYLKAWGALPEKALSGKEALSLLKESISSEDSFDLIITDIQMPGMNGFDLAQSIRMIEPLQNMPIIILKTISMKKDEKIFTDLKIKESLTKPVRRDDLHRAIISAMKLYRKEDKKPVLNPITVNIPVKTSRQQIRILLVEDHPTSQKLIMKNLQGAGHLVDLVENGAQAVETYTRKPYDLILMDIQMPVMDGYAAAKAIRDLESNLSEGPDISNTFQRVPIIVMTAHAIEGVKERCLEAGMDDYITKPLRKIDLLSTVDRWAMSRLDSLQEVSSPCDESTRNSRQDRSADTDVHDDIPMDIDRTLEEFEGNKEFLMVVIDGFLEHAGNQIDTIRRALSDGDSEMVMRTAHSMKGGAATLTADKLSGIACELEVIGESGSLERGGDVLKILEKEFHRLEVYIQDIKVSPIRETYIKSHNQ
jgi:two-component system sensor histidine kinase/response regulator